MSAADQECQHSYTFLQQEKVCDYPSDRECRSHRYFDIYFCQHCLDYKRVHAKSTETDYYSGKESVTWRKGQ